MVANFRAEAVILSVDASAKEVITAARWHCLLQQEAEALPAQETPQEPSPGPEHGVSSLGRAGPFQRPGKDTSLPHGPCHLRAGGASEGPWLQARSWGHFGLVSSLSAIQRVPRGSRASLADGRLSSWWMPVSGGWGAHRGQLHHCPAPLPERAFVLALAGAPPSPLSQLWVFLGGRLLLPAVGLFPKFHPTGLEQVNLGFSGGVSQGWTWRTPVGRSLGFSPDQQEEAQAHQLLQQMVHFVLARRCEQDCLQSQALV